MNSYRKSAAIVGSLFIITTLTYGIGDGLIQELFTKANSLEYTSKMVIAVLLQLLCGFGVIGIAIVMYPIFKLFNEKLALLYVGNRLIECTIIALSGISLLTFIEFKKENFSDLKEFTSPFLLEYHANFLMLSLVLSFGAFVFYYVLFKSRLIPRFISIWGFIAVILMDISLLMDMLDYSETILLYIPMGLNELFLGIWLIFKRFNKTVMPKTV